MLEIKNLQVKRRRQTDPQGDRSPRERRRSPRHHGPQRVRQEHARARAGRAPEYEVTGGEVLYEGKDLLDMDPDERAREGVFMAFQYPVEIAGVNNAYFLKAALNAKRKHHGQPELDAMEFMQLIKEKSKLLDIDQSMLSRAVNEGFSGGEKKRNEIFQMALLEPKLAILDETDSGLDIDALKLVANGVNAMRSPETRDHRRHALPAAARLHRARLRARPERRPHRQVRRQGAGAGAREEGLRLDRDRRAAGRSMSAMTQVAEKLQPWLAAIEQRPQGGPRWLQDLRDRARRGSPRSASRPCATRSGASPTSRPSRRRNSGRRRADAARATEEELTGYLYSDAEHRIVIVNGRFVAGAVARCTASRQACASARWRRRSPSRPRSCSAISASLPNSARTRLHGAEHGARRRRRVRLHSRRRRPRAAAAPAVRDDGVRDLRPDHVERRVR